MSEVEDEGYRRRQKASVLAWLSGRCSNYQWYVRDVAHWEEVAAAYPPNHPVRRKALKEAQEAHKSMAKAEFLAHRDMLEYTTPLERFMARAKALSDEAAALLAAGEVPGPSRPLVGAIAAQFPRAAPPSRTEIEHQAELDEIVRRRVAEWAAETRK